MQGNIYTREKCTQCKTTLKYTKGKGCICPEHYRETGQIARTMYVWFPGKIHVNFQDCRCFAGRFRIQCNWQHLDNR